MSDSNSQRLLIEATQDVYFNRALIAGTCLVLYDYLLTLPSEISEICNSKFTGAKVLFFVTRYSYIVYVLFLFALNFVTHPSQTVCRVVFYTHFAWSIPPHLGLYAIFTLRTYAIYQQSWLILVLLAITGVIQLISLALTPQVIYSTQRRVEHYVCCRIDPSCYR
ncbi:hypothetical protein BD410DRAFT_792993 [Rickenella mellea]|uniref:DUF6533 domain-containing protein n=1 Tax=Rickenella mellea TaxID=50990 RepID=A0A4Y7PTZ7_9AGAM|nr:hypothetical protein BD410DRAFT_792993 [Rickenella mellea]